MNSPKQDLLAGIRQVSDLVRARLGEGEEVTLFYTPAPAVGREKENAPPVAARKQTAPLVRPQHLTSPVGEKSASQTPAAVLATEAEACVVCSLHRDRVRTVWGEGSQDAPVVFIGDAPGAEEERAGRPFRGPAGELLDKILASIGLDRSRVFLCNLLKCRLPGNRNPAPEEMAACRGHLEKQLALLKPGIIVTLGAFAAQTLLGTTEPLSRLQGQTHAYRGIPVIPTLHPEALLLYPQHKRQVWEDMKRVAVLLAGKNAPVPDPNAAEISPDA